MSDLSRVEGILQATINGTPYNEHPQSRVEELLLELKQVIEQGGGGGSVVSIDQILKSGVNIADLTINGNKTHIYAPQGGSGSESLSDLTDVALSGLANGDVLAYDSATQKWINTVIQSGGVVVTELTQGAYNVLTEQQKKNGSIYLTHDGGYDFISYDDGKIIVRVNNTTNETLWFFNGFYKDSADIDIPEALVPYLPTQTSAADIIQAKSWTDDTSSTTNGWIGFVYPGKQNVKIRSWAPGFSTTISGYFWGVLDIDGSTEQGGQTSNYYEPTEGLTIVPNRMYFNDTIYSECGGTINNPSTVLYSASAFASTIQLSEVITKFDYILLHGETNVSGTIYENSALYYVPALTQGCKIGFTDDADYSWYTLIDYDTFTFDKSGGNQYYIKDVIGIKLDNGSGPGNYLDQMTLSDYARLTPQQQMDGRAIFIPESDIGFTDPFDMTAITTFCENANMEIDAASNHEVDVTWHGSVYIGASFRSTNAIDVTNWDKLVFKVLTGSCYGGGATAQQRRWNLQIGLMDHAINAIQNIDASSSDWKAVAEFDKSNHDYGEIELDISALTGEMYITVVCVGWNAVLEDFQFATLGGYSSRIMYMGDAYGLIEPTTELIELGAGDDTTSRTFTFSKTPKRVSITFKSSDASDSWTIQRAFNWGDTGSPYIAGQESNVASGGYGMGVLSYDGNSVTLTGNNAIQTCNTSTGHGTMYIEY